MGKNQTHKLMQKSKVARAGGGPEDEGNDGMVGRFDRIKAALNCCITSILLINYFWGCIVEIEQH